MRRACCRTALPAGRPHQFGPGVRERIADAAWTFDTDRQRTVMMIVEAQSARQRHLAVRLLRYVVDRLLELCEDRARHDPAPAASGRGRPLHRSGRWRMPSLPDLFSPVAQALMRFEFPCGTTTSTTWTAARTPTSPWRLAFDIERAGDPGETVPVAEAVRALEDEEAHALMMRFLSDKMRQWINLRDARGRRLVDERHTAGLAEGLAAGEIVGVLVSFRRALANSGLDHRLAAEVEAYADRIVEAVRRGVRFDLDDIPDAARLMAAIRDGGGPAQGVRRADLGPAATHPGRGCGAGVAPGQPDARTEDRGRSPQFRAPDGPQHGLKRRTVPTGTEDMPMTARNQYQQGNIASHVIQACQGLTAGCVHDLPAMGADPVPESIRKWPVLGLASPFPLL